MKKTQSAGGIVVRSDFILVVNQDGTTWSLPKGHIKKGEDKIATAKREIYEESGITDLEFIKELGNYQRYKLDKEGGEDKTELKTIFMLLFQTKQKKLNPQDPRNPEARWVKRKEVTKLLTHPKDKEFYIKIKKLI